GTLYFAVSFSSVRPDTGACPWMGAASRLSAFSGRGGRAESARPAETVAVVPPTCPTREHRALRCDGLPQREALSHPTRSSNEHLRTRPEQCGDRRLVLRSRGVSSRWRHYAGTEDRARDR